MMPRHICGQEEMGTSLCNTDLFSYHSVFMYMVFDDFSKTKTIQWKTQEDVMSIVYAKLSITAMIYMYVTYEIYFFFPFRCVYFDEAQTQQWTTGDGRCSVSNTLTLSVDSYVDCACNHMSHYAVISMVKNPELVGYPIWFHISCFICMVSLLLT